MRILITGTTGFIGANLARFLSGNDNQIAALIREDSNTEPLSNCIDHISVYKTKEKHSDIVSIFNEFKPELVIHLASLFLTHHQPEQIEDLIDSNILFGVKLLEAMVKCKRTKLINTGTSWQHFNNETYNPVNLYASTKQAFEDICDYYVQTQGLKIITLKLFETYGPDDPREKLIPLLINSIGKEEILDLSPGEQKLDIVHIDDVCSAYQTALTLLSSLSSNRHYKYGVSSGTSITLQKLVETIERISGSKLPINWGGRPYRDREVFNPWTGFESLPDWKTNISIERGLQPLIFKQTN